jgi:hypothetical protein
MPGISNGGNGCSRIRVTLPISVACDLQKFQRAMANVSDRIHESGSSRVGMYLRAREFIVDACTLQVSEDLEL